MGKHVTIDMGNGHTITGQAISVNDEFALFEVNVSGPEYDIPADIMLVLARIVHGTKFLTLKVPAHRVKVLTDGDVNGMVDEMFSFLPPDERPYGIF